MLILHRVLSLMMNMWVSVVHKNNLLVYLIMSTMYTTPPNTYKEIYKSTVTSISHEVNVVCACNDLLT